MNPQVKQLWLQKAIEITGNTFFDCDAWFDSTISVIQSPRNCEVIYTINECIHNTVWFLGKGNKPYEGVIRVAKYNKSESWVIVSFADGDFAELSNLYRNNEEITMMYGMEYDEFIWWKCMYGRDRLEIKISLMELYNEGKETYYQILEYAHRYTIEPILEAIPDDLIKLQNITLNVNHKL